MRKFLVTLIILLTLSAQVEATPYEYATFAIDTINQKLREWKCTPLKFGYAGDDCNNEDGMSTTLCFEN